MGSLAAIVIAGGASSRFGSDKLAARDATGRTLLEVTVLGAAEVADPVVVVGPEVPLPVPVVWAREEPPGSGPCAALVAGLSCLPPEATHVAVLAGDAPRGADAIPALRQVIDDAAVATVVDDLGREQPMTAVYAVAPLTAVTRRYGDGAGMPIRRALEDLRSRTVVALMDQWGASDDVDSAEDAARLGFRPDTSRG
ncbi:MAG: molybdenum cofactor guanylyltransferase [bacterium]